MNKNEYLDRLSRLLSDISYEEHEEALSYYREYLEDAGAENEQQVMEELGTPEQLARKIREGLSEKGEPSKRQGTPISAPGLSNQSYSNAGPNSADYRQSSYSDNSNHSGTYNQTAANPKKNKSTAILVIIALILTSPLWFSLACTVISAVFGCIVAVIAIAIGIGASGIVCMIAGIALIIAGFCALLSITVFSVSGTLVGFALIGSGLIVTALGILFLILTVWLCGWALPAIVRLIRQSVSNLSRKRRTEHQ